LAGDDAQPVWDKLTAALDARGIEWLKLDAYVAPEAALFVDGVHLSAEGHRQVGEALAEYLASSSETD
jgi:lysophospholipase L1-like esterase